MNNRQLSSRRRLASTEIQRLTDYVKELPLSQVKIAILLLLQCGVRPREAIELLVQDISFQRKELCISSISKDRVIPIPESLLQQLKDFIEDLHLADEDYLFPWHSGTFGSTRPLDRHVQNIAEKAGLQGRVQARDLRLAYARSFIFDQGGDLEELLPIMGYTDVRHLIRLVN